MTIETFLAVIFLAVAVIGFAAYRLTETNRVKYVDQKVKVRGEKEYVIFLYI